MMQAPGVARRWAIAFVICWLLLGPLSLSIVLSAVTIAGFEVEAGEQAINVYWETASETDNLGFYVWRSEQPDTGYVKLPTGVPESQQFIPSEDLGFGAFYEFTDEQVTSGVLYYYKLQDYPASGSPIFVGPESAGIGLTSATATSAPTTAPSDTNTPTATATATSVPPSMSTPTSTASPLPPGSTPAPEPSVRFWAEETTLAAGECTTVQWVTSNVRAVFFDGTSATGQEARTFCPCEDQTHTLRVTYRDGTSETFTVTLSVTGTCDGVSPDSPTSPVATSTPRSTATPRPTATPAATRMASVTEQPTTTPGRRTATPTATPTAPSMRPGETANLSVTPTRNSDVAETTTEAASSQTPLATDLASNNGVVVEGRSVSRSSSMVLLLIFASIAGIGLVAVGVWLWRRG